MQAARTGFAGPLLLALLSLTVAAEEESPPSKGESAAAVWSRVLAASEPRPLPLEKVIRSGAILSADGKSLYAYRHREIEDFRNLYDIVHEDLRTGKARVLKDAGSDCYYLARCRDLVFGTASVKAPRKHRIFAFRGKRLATHRSRRLVVSGFEIANGHLIYEDDDGVKVLAKGGRSKLLVASSHVRDLYPGHPNRNEFIMDVGEDKSRTMFRFVQFDLDSGKVNTKDLFRATATRTYAYPRPWTKSRILYWESIDTNGDGEVNYKDASNSQIRACDLTTGELTTVIERRMELVHLETHPSGIVLFAERIGTGKEERTAVLFYDPDSGTEHRVLEMAGDLRFFTLDPEWTKLVFFQITDTSGDDDIYYWEDASEGFVVHLPRE